MIELNYDESITIITFDYLGNILVALFTAGLGMASRAFATVERCQKKYILTQIFVYCKFYRFKMLVQCSISRMNFLVFLHGSNSLHSADILFTPHEPSHIFCFLGTLVGKVKRSYVM